jgi:hypothetical protein
VLVVGCSFQVRNCGQSSRLSEGNAITKFSRIEELTHFFAIISRDWRSQITNSRFSRAYPTHTRLRVGIFRSICEARETQWPLDLCRGVAS